MVTRGLPRVAVRLVPGSHGFRVTGSWCKASCSPFASAACLQRSRFGGDVTDTVVPGSAARYGGSSPTCRERLRILGAWFSFGWSDGLLSRAAAGGESRRTGSTGAGGFRLSGTGGHPGDTGVVPQSQTKHVALRSVSGEWTAAHVPPSGGAGWNREIWFFDSLGALDRHRSVWLRPQDLLHRMVFWTGLFGGSCSQLAVRHLVRSRFGRFPAFGLGSTVRIHRRSLEAIRLRSGGLRTGYDFEPLASHSSSGGRQTDGARSGSSASRTLQTLVYRGLFGALVGVSGARRVEDLPPVVLRLARVHPSGRNRTRRSSLASFGTLLPTSNVPIRAQRTPAGVIFGWQTRRPKASIRVPRDFGGVVFGRQYRSSGALGRVQRTIAGVIFGWQPRWLGASIGWRGHGATHLRAGGHRVGPGAHDRRTPADHHMVDANLSDLVGRGCRLGTSQRGRAEGQRHRFRRTAARRLER